MKTRSPHHRLQPHLGRGSCPFFDFKSVFVLVFSSICPNLNSVTAFHGGGVMSMRRPQIYGGSVCLLVIFGWLATGFASCCVEAALLFLVCCSGTSTSAVLLLQQFLIGAEMEVVRGCAVGVDRGDEKCFGCEIWRCWVLKRW
jgi:hypothetical protein